jgi:hypothetical protein
VDVFQPFRIPAVHFPLFPLIVAAPAQVPGHGIAEALEGQGNMIRNFSIPGGPKSFPRVHGSHTIDKGIF